MLLISLILIIVGALVGVGAFAFAAGNMLSVLRNEEWSLLGLFTGHLGAMIAMLVGGLISSLGTILLVVALVLMFV